MYLKENPVSYQIIIQEGFISIKKCCNIRKTYISLHQQFRRETMYCTTKVAVSWASRGGSVVVKLSHNGDSRDTGSS